MQRLLTGFSVAALAVVAGVWQAPNTLFTSTGTPAASSAAGVASPFGPRELTTDQQVLQVLNRLTFGPRPGDIEKVRAMGVDKFVDQQLHPERIDDSATEQFLAHYPTLAMSTADAYRQYPPPQLLRALARRQGRDSAMSVQDSMRLREMARKSNQVVADVMSAKVARAVMSERQLDEVMVDFWENHFTVFAGKGQVRYMLSQYDRETIRPYALGKFRDLLGAVAKSPAMLFYLDNVQSVADSMHPTLAAARRPGFGRGGLAGIGRRPLPGNINRPGIGRLPIPGAPGQQLPGDTALMRQAAQQRRARGLNENYARELMELHTLGVDGGYTQQDIIEVARALTGWGIRPPQAGGPEFLFRPEVHDAGEKHVLGHTLKAGRGIEDGEDVLDIVARHPSTARFIATKLARRFVSDTPSKALVDRAAATFTKTDGDIRETLRTILTSPEFFSRAAYRGKVKSPFEVVVSALRAVNAAPDSTPRTAQMIARLGQPIWGHQAPNGWPETGDAWMNTGAILNRINFGMTVAAGRIPGVSLARWPEGQRLVNAPRPEQVDGVVATILGGDVSKETREVLLSGENPLLDRAMKDTSRADVTRDELVPSDSMMMGRGGRGGRQGPPGGPPPLGGRGQFAGRGFGPIPPLNGLPQVVGLALGSPEFQRR